MANTSGCPRRRKEYKGQTDDRTQSTTPYIILLDNFMGPILKRAAQQKKKKATKLKAPHFNSNHHPPSSHPMICTVRAILCWFTGWQDGKCCWRMIQGGGRGGQRADCCVYFAKRKCFLLSAVISQVCTGLNTRKSQTTDCLYNVYAAGVHVCSCTVTRDKGFTPTTLWAGWYDAHDHVAPNSVH